MPQELVIDIHTHTFPNAEIGKQAMMGRGQSGYAGTIPEVLSVMQHVGISHVAMVNMTPVQEMRMAALERLPHDTSARAMALAERQQLAEMIGRVIRRNEWTCGVSREHPELFAFIGLVPEMGSEAMLDELEDKLAKGAHGLKLHPAECAFYPANPALWPVYRRCEELDLPVLAHSGEFFLPMESARLRFFVPVLRAFPQLKLVLAHLGKPDFAEAREIAATFPNAYFDTSTAITGGQHDHQVPPGEEVRLIREIGVERVLFGTDFPWLSQERDFEFISRLALSDGERRAILGENAARLLGLTS